jgi:ParB-like chromosome segregation protein Spo0J
MPPHTKEEFKELKEDIRKNKLQVPIMTYEDKILDGRGRYNACVELAKEGVETNFRTNPYTGPDPRRYVVSANVKRRHLNESQRALIAAQLATFTHGGDRSKASIDALTQKEAAELLNVSEPSVERAVKVLKNGVPALVEAVKDGKLRVSAVESFAKSNEQDKLITECKGNVVEAVKKLPPRKKKKKTESAKDMMEELEAFKQTWDGFNPHQKNAFVKANRHEITEILDGLEFEEQVAEQEEGEGEEEAQASLS